MLIGGEQSAMTPEDQLGIWSARPNDEVFVWFDQHPGDDVGLGSIDVGSLAPSESHGISRTKAASVLSALRGEQRVNRYGPPDVVARFLKQAPAECAFKVQRIKGVDFVILEGNSPIAPHSPYRLLISSVEPFK